MEKVFALSFACEKFRNPDVVSMEAKRQNVLQQSPTPLHRMHILNELVKEPAVFESA